MLPARVFAFVLFTVFCTMVYSEQKVYSNYFQTSDNLKIHYLTSGDQGNYVVLVHAYGANAQGNWMRTGILQALAKNHRVVAIDCRNHGKSDKPNPNRFGIARDVLELMEHLNIEQAHLHGYSMGGGIVGQLLLRHQDRFITASIGGSGFGESDPERIAQTPRDKTSRRAKPASPILPGPAESLSFITVPVMAIVGEFDNPNQKTVRMKREITHFKRVVIRNRGHAGAVLDKKYRKELVKFISKNDG